MTRTPRNLSQLQQAVDRNVVLQAQRASFETTITPELADTLGKAYTLGRYTNPEVIASAAVAGITNFDDLHKNVATQLLKQGIIPGREDKRVSKNVSDYSDFVNAQEGQVITVPDPKTGKPIQVTIGGPRTRPTAAFTAPGQTPTGLRFRTEEEIAATKKRQADLAKRVPVTDTSKASSIYSLRGMQGGGGDPFKPAQVSDVISVPLGIVGIPFHFAGAAISMMSPDFLEPVAKATRATTKAVTLPALSAGEFTYNFVSMTLRDAYAAGQTDANPFERFQAALSPQKIFNNLGLSLMSTSLVQAGVDLIEGDLDTGGGWFVRGETAQRAEALQEEFVGTVAEATGVDPRTAYSAADRKVLERKFEPGFLAAEMAVDAKLTSRDGELYDFINDAVNLYVRVGTDVGIYGLDPSDFVINSLVKKFGMTRQIATSYLDAKRAKNFTEAAKIAAENKFDVAVADLMSDYERQLQAAKDVFIPDENVVYSGDRTFIDGKTVETFLDVDDPDFVPNTKNLFGEGLYITDQPLISSTTGYNVPGGVSWTDVPDDSVAKLIDILPEETKDQAAKITGLNQGNAGVWKFDKTDLNVIDSAVQPTKEVFDIATVALADSLDPLTKVLQGVDLEDAENIYNDIKLVMMGTDPLPLSPFVESFNPDSIRKYLQENPERFGVYGEWGEEALDRLVDSYVNSPEMVTFRENNKDIYEYLNKLFDYENAPKGFIDNFVLRIASEVANHFAYTPSTLDRLQTSHWAYASFEDMYRDYTKFYKTDNRNIMPVLGILGGSPGPILNDLFYVAFKENLDFIQMKQLQIKFLLPWVGDNLLKQPLIKEFLDPATSSARMMELPKLIDKQIFDNIPKMSPNGTNPIVTALVNNGYDGIKYQGGRLGVAGDHNAYVVWKPSKLKHVDILTGEKFPTNKALELVDESDRLRYRAEELENLRETEEGFRQGLGLMGENPRSLDPTLVNNMRHTKAGQSILQKIANETDPVVIWRDYLKRKSPFAAIRLSKAKTIDEVWAIIDEAVVSGDPNINIRELPSNGWQDWASDTGYKVKQKVDRYSKQTAMMPDETYIPFDDASIALERTDRVLQVAGVKGKERDVVLRALFDTLEAGTSKAWDNFFEVANKASLRQKMVDAGWTEDQIRMATSYRRKGDNITRWTLEDLADDIPIEWFDEGDGPLRITQLLSGGGYLIDPDVLDELIRDTGPLVNALSKLTNYNPKILKVIGGSRKVNTAIEQKFLQAWVKPAALGAPLPIRYIMRVVPEETLRVAFSGEFDNLGQYVAQIFSGHLNYDTFGRTIMDSVAAAEEMAKLQHLKDEYAVLQQQLTTSPSLAQKTQKRIDAIEKKYGTEADLQSKIDELAARIDNNLPGDQRALVNKVRGHLESTYDPNVLDSFLSRSKVQQIVSNQVLDPDNITSKERLLRESWVEAQAMDIAEMSVNPDYAAVADALLNGDAAALEQIAQEFLGMDKLGKVYDKYTKNVWGTKSGWDWRTIEAARSRVSEIALDIRQRTALQPEILQAISSGKHNGTTISLEVIDNVYNPSPGFKQLVRDTLLDNPDAPKQVPHFPLVKSNPKAVRNNNFMYKSFSLYTKSSAAMARNPLWAQSYWRRVQEMLPAMDSAEAAKLVSDNTGKLPDYLINSLNDSLPEAKGVLNRDEVSRLAEAHAKDVVDKLLFNAQTNKSYFAYRHQIMFMFFDAYREQWATWLKLMKQPKNLHKVDLAVRELQKFREPFAEGENAILHNDTNTGKQVLTVPFSRWMLGLTGGDSQFSIPTRNLSFVGSVAPGIGPVAQLTASSWKPSSEEWANAKSTFMPFTTGDVSVDWRDYILPQFAQLLASGIAGKGKDKLSQADILWSLVEKASGTRVEEMKKASVVPIMRQLATKIDKYPMTPEGRQQLLDDSNALSNNMAIARGLARVFLPGAPITQFYVDTKQGGMLQGMLLDEIRTTENEVYARGGNLSEAVSILLDKWGTGIWTFFGSSSETNIPGLQPTKEYQKWVFSNKGLLDKYPMAGGYLGPQLGEYNAKVFMQQMQLDQRQTKGAAVSMEEAANLYADVYFDYQMSTIPEEWENSAQATQFRDKIRTETEQKFPTWNPMSGAADAQTKRRVQFQEINKMLADPNITSSPAGRGLKEYMDARNVAIPEMVKFASGDVTERNWSSVNASYSLRQYLYDLGNKIASDIPEFGPMWTNVLAKEFNKKDLKISTEVAQ